MVGFTNVSQYSKTSPQRGGGEKIPGGPLYPLTQIREIVKDGTGVSLWTRDCVANVAELGWSNRDVIELLLSLKASDYVDSEWCENGRGAFAACDSYAVTRNEWINKAGKSMRIEYFLKFAVNNLGTMVLTISCHV